MFFRKSSKIINPEIFLIGLIIILLTPLINIFFYPSGRVWAASGSSSWSEELTWGIHPFVFMALEKDTLYHCIYFQCSGEPTSYYNMVYDVHGVLTEGEMSGGFSDNLLKTGSYSHGIFIPVIIEFILDIILNLIISYLFVFLVFAGYRKMRSIKLIKEDKT